jgi:hypothetical protein
MGPHLQERRVAESPLHNQQDALQPRHQYSNNRHTYRPRADMCYLPSTGTLEADEFEDRIFRPDMHPDYLDQS